MRPTRATATALLLIVGIAFAPMTAAAPQGASETAYCHGSTRPCEMPTCKDLEYFFENGAVDWAMSCI